MSAVSAAIIISVACASVLVCAWLYFGLLVDPADPGSLR
jgi:hypothetical protein